MIGLGIGDLHYDGPLLKYVPDLNQVITEEVVSVIEANIREGIKFVVFYGDVGHRPVLSQEAHKCFLSVIKKYPKLRFIVVKGNHDEHDSGSCGLDLLQLLGEWFVPNLLVLTRKSKTIFDGKLRLCPWPNKDVEIGPLNVLHLETFGSKMDTGREYEGAPKIVSKAQCVSGHLHTAQKTTNVDYCGTLYQTSFGEADAKYYHRITLTESKHQVELVPHCPKYKLVNLVVNKQSDLNKIEDDKYTLYKLFVQKDVVLDAAVDLPNVVKTNHYATKAELKALMHEELVLDDASNVVRFDSEQMLQEWLKQNSVTEDLAERVLAKNKLLLENLK